MFIKLKYENVTIKERGCDNVSKQRNSMSKEDTTSPTMSPEGLMLSGMIDSMEGRDVATADILGVFLHTDYDRGNVHKNMEGPMVTLLE